MKTRKAEAGEHTATVRAGVIGLLAPTICYLWMSGLSDLPSVWLFIILFAACFVLMMVSIVDLLVLGFGYAARIGGKGIGWSVKAVRQARGAGCGND